MFAQTRHTLFITVVAHTMAKAIEDLVGEKQTELVVLHDPHDFRVEGDTITIAIDSGDELSFTVRVANTTARDDTVAGAMRRAVQRRRLTAPTADTVDYTLWAVIAPSCIDLYSETAEDRGVGVFVSG